MTGTTRTYDYIIVGAGPSAIGLLLGILETYNTRTSNHDSKVVVPSTISIAVVERGTTMVGGNPFSSTTTEHQNEKSASSLWKDVKNPRNWFRASHNALPTEDQLHSPVVSLQHKTTIPSSSFSIGSSSSNNNNNNNTNRIVDIPIGQGIGGTTNINAALCIPPLEEDFKNWPEYPWKQNIMKSVTKIFATLEANDCISYIPSTKKDTFFLDTINTDNTKVPCMATAVNNNSKNKETNSKCNNNINSDSHTRDEYIRTNYYDGLLEPYLNKYPHLRRNIHWICGMEVQRLLFEIEQEETPGGKNCNAPDYTITPTNTNNGDNTDTHTTATTNNRKSCIRVIGVEGLQLSSSSLPSDIQKKQKSDDDDVGDNNSIFEKIYATKEVILCCGAIESPILLLISGIGHHQDLKDANIPDIHTALNPSYDDPTIGTCSSSVSSMCSTMGVGRNLRDHIMLPYMSLHIPTMATNNNNHNNIMRKVFNFFSSKQCSSSSSSTSSKEQEEAKEVQYSSSSLQSSAINGIYGIEQIQLVQDDCCAINNNHNGNNNHRYNYYQFMDIFPNPEIIIHFLIAGFFRRCFSFTIMNDNNQQALYSTPQTIETIFQFLKKSLLSFIHMPIIQHILNFILIKHSRFIRVINICLMNPKSIGKLSIIKIPTTTEISSPTTSYNFKSQNVSDGENHYNIFKQQQKSSSDSMVLRRNQIRINIDVGYLKNQYDILALMKGWKFISNNTDATTSNNNIKVVQNRTVCDTDNNNNNSTKSSNNSNDDHKDCNCTQRNHNLAIEILPGGFFFFVFRFLMYMYSKCIMIVSMLLFPIRSTNDNRISKKNTSVNTTTTTTTTTTTRSRNNSHHNYLSTSSKNDDDNNNNNNKSTYNFCNGYEEGNDSNIERRWFQLYVSNFSVPYYHFCGTCAMKMENNKHNNNNNSGCEQQPKIMKNLNLTKAKEKAFINKNDNKKKTHNNNIGIDLKSTHGKNTQEVDTVDVITTTAASYNNTIDTKYSNETGTYIDGNGNDNVEEWVVDSYLKVRNITNLRVCDASIFPTTISVPTALTCTSIGYLCGTSLLFDANDANGNDKKRSSVK